MSFPAFLSWACRNVVGGIIFLLAHPFLSETPRGQTQTPSRPSEQHRAISLAWDMHMIVFADVPMLPPCILHTLQSASRCLPPPSGLGGGHFGDLALSSPIHITLSPSDNGTKRRLSGGSRSSSLKVRRRHPPTSSIIFCHCNAKLIRSAT